MRLPPLPLHPMLTHPSFADLPFVIDVEIAAVVGRDGGTGDGFYSIIIITTASASAIES